MFTNRGCNTCHRVGGGNLIGPDLAGVTQRRSEKWLTTWLKDPAAVDLLATATEVVDPRLESILEVVG